MSQPPAFSQRFVAEAREHLAAMSSAMIDLERNQGTPQLLIDQLLRAAHSLKGGAGFIGRRNIERLSHAFEAAIESLRDGHVVRTPEVVDTLLAVLDRISALVDDVDHSDEADISRPLEQLRPLGKDAVPQVALAPLPKQGQPAVTSLAREFELSRELLQAWPPDDSFLYGVKLDWFQCERQLGLSPIAVADRLERAGSVLDSKTSLAGPALVDGMPQPPCWLLAAVSSTDGPESFTGTLNIACATIVLLRQRSDERKAPASPSPRSEAPHPRAVAPATSLRVSVPLVDRMMALAGELVLVRNQALRSTEAANSPLRRLLRRLDSVTDELQDAALRMRTQPVGTLFDRFPRVVRDLARQLEKQIDVRITGSEVELDKTILELLADPLTHLIRNCCDHGIELPQDRASSGKPPAGRVDLSARQERGQIVIEIRDDGRGIDVQAVKRKALEQGLRQGDELERMSDRQAFGLILLSGFSTAARVTDLSGRGVGMDVVKTNLDQIGGMVEIDSTAGKGSLFTLRLPLTLAIMPCLLLGSDGQCYGVPQRDIEEIVMLDASEARRRVERNHDTEVLRWRGRLLPVTRVREVLRSLRPSDPAAMADVAERYHRDAANPSTSYAVVIRLGARRFVMLFDEVRGSENIVVKPLHPLLRPLGIYAATTILGDGTVALIFSVEGVARHGGVFDLAVTDTAEPAARSPGDAPEEPLLLFRCVADELLAVRMASVRRVVKFSSKRIERVGGRELVNVDGVVTNVVRLDWYLNVQQCTEEDSVLLLLPKSGQTAVGIPVWQIVDTPTLSVQPDSRAYRAKGVLGSLMIRGQIALLIDLEQVVRMWEENGRPQRDALAPRTASRILVVDDTEFFRKLVAEHLRSAGHEVMVADNGNSAVSMLRNERFDLVVCDIEMPLMDGHAFARAVRGDPRVASVPLLALTTLNTAESRAAAADSGFDAYEVKLDRQTLLSTVRRLLDGAKHDE